MEDERDLIAAERALGHAPRYGETAEDVKAREAWETRLSPLLDAVPPVAPGAGLWQRIEDTIDDQSRATAANVISLAESGRQVRRWKGIASLAVAAAAAMALYLAVPVAGPPPEAAQYVAIVTADDGSGTGLVIHFDTVSGAATVIPATAPPAGASYEMWTIPEGKTKPVSLGLLPSNAVATRIEATQDQIFAISLEPLGGSPSGQPTTPLYHGTVQRVE
jgi:anti-sigma-K factor RskA